MVLIPMGCNADRNQEKKQATKSLEHTEVDEHEHTTGKINTGKAEEGTGDVEEIHFSKAQAEAVGLAIETVLPSTFRQVVKTSGQILSSQGDETTISATANGLVSFLNRSIAPGTTIRAGETVVSVSAQNLPEGDPVAKAKIAYETVRKDFLRAENLVKEQIISVKDFEQVRLRYETAKTEYEAQASNYRAGSVNVTSPIGGYVKNIYVNQGDFVSVGQPIATVSQNKRLQLRAEVSENYFRCIRAIQSAHFKTAYDDTLYKLTDLNGQLVSYGKASDSHSFFIPVIFEFDNVVDIIPGSFAEIYLLALPQENVLSVPVSAITEEQGLYFLYLQLDEEGYKKQEVTLGQSDGSRIQVLTGLKQGDKVVTKGVYQVKLAATTSVIPEGHSH